MSQQPASQNPNQDPIDLSYNEGAVGDEEFEDFFAGFGKSEKYTLPDGDQYIEFQLLNEGQKAKFQKETRSAININRKTDNASVMPDPSRERHELIKASVCDWKLYTRHQQTGKKIPVIHNKVNLDLWLKRADPKLVGELEQAIRKANPWMLDDVTIEDIDEQIEELQQLREEKERLEAEKSGAGKSD